MAARRPKSLTDAGIRKLNDACGKIVRDGSCDGSCDVLGARMGWCGAAWSALAPADGEDMR